MSAPIECAPTCVDLDVLAAERFRCEPLSCTLSVLSCARRHVLAQTSLTGLEGFAETVRHLRVEQSACRACEVGAANARRARL